jgi:TetR/AcrR family transcriptional regulator, transcriptional repressor for nem operon
MARPQEFETADALNKAMRVFWNQGYEATSLADLMAATGLSKSSLYGTFGDKREFFLAAYDVYRAERAREMEAILNTGPARQTIETFFGKIIADASAVEFSNGCMSTNQAVELAPHDPLVRHRVETDFQMIEDAFARTIARGQTEGSVKTVKDARMLASLFVVVFPGLQVMVRAGAVQSRLKEALELLLSNLDE